LAGTQAWRLHRGASTALQNKQSQEKVRNCTKKRIVMKPQCILNLDFFDWVTYHYKASHEIPTEADFRKMIARFAGGGFDTINFRTSVCGKVCYPSKVMDVFTGDYRLDCNILARVMEKWNPLSVVVDACRKNNLTVWAWITLFDSYCIGLEDSFFSGRPDLLMRSRDGKNALRGVPCYASPETQQYRLREAREVSELGVDAIFYSMHSHTCCSRLDGDPEGENIFGYNPEIVEAFKDRHGINILTDEFEPYDLYKLQGEFLTTYLSDVRDLLKPKGQGLYCTFAWDNDDGIHGTGPTVVHFGYSKGRSAVPYHRMVGIHLDCENWMRRGIANGLAAQTDHVDEIVKVKELAGGGDFYVWLFCGFDKNTAQKRVSTLKRVTQEAQEAQLCGCILHEQMSFDMSPSLWDVIEPRKR
jgi:hypothetical protein